MTTDVARLEKAEKTTQERFAEFLRIYASLNTRLAYATDLGIPLEWVPGYRPADPQRRRGRARRSEPTGLEWLAWCLRNGFTSFAEIRVEHVERWLEDLARAGYRDATRARMLSAVSAFYRKYLMREGLSDHNPAALVDRAAQHLNRAGGTPSTTAMWSFEACRALLLAAYLLADRSRNGRRDRAMIEVLIGTGVRAEELVGVNLADYHRPTPGGPGSLRVHGKGAKDRRVALAAPVADALESYLADRVLPTVPALPGQNAIPTREPLFLTSTGARVHVSHVQALLRRLCATFTPDSPPRARWLRDLLTTESAAFIATHLAPLRETIHPHSARHSYATHAIDRGAEPRQVQRDLGHAALTTTEGYLHDANNLANSATHELSPALHRGWLSPTIPG
ncbi:tyrosine-type recombinase/integrase [Saccharopolyspora phatthalungensis]|uniref:Integrase/recombinase XerC n=1 Tax=Saccharopolyspora phatthalungensis TaxID=664693 RepID=A0A840QHY6_9PSEU|nr:tyrosine-type recombinase/integrase [Saccharopolyspora phatthalungensis]MBB5158279.1 integrase/recombinase XerC [Saccharopolyspora phatthalungensis]